ncbi:hypothetical protein SDC9_118826 [bioreactor metagenome]|jgi:hypothetical protein|uniref:DUF3006 domain-containing protein n=1 Tax=bioreactor metagenome TaxID=1076179 RepID=A0A645C2U6_9ZZZZ|nr:hypothetical protein [Synergistaceae bacterium]
MAVKREKIFVDSINEEICTLLVGKKAFSVDLPARILPRGTSEGDWLIMTLQKSERLKRSYHRSLEGLLEKLEGNS